MKKQILVTTARPYSYFLDHIAKKCHTCCKCFKEIISGELYYEKKIMTNSFMFYNKKYCKNCFDGYINSKEIHINENC